MADNRLTIESNSYRDREPMREKNRLVRALAGRVAVGFVAVLSAAAALNAQSNSSGLTTVCAIATEPEKFDGRSVSIRAYVFSDGMHGSYIYDQSCERYGLGLFVSHGAKGEDQLDAALGWCHLSTRGKSISGTFTGVFHFRPTYIGDTDRRSIIVNRIENLVLRSTKTVSASFPTPCPDAPSLDSLVHTAQH